MERKQIQFILGSERIFFQMWYNNNNKIPAWQTQDVRIRYKE